jgi:hypothetical protein
VVGSADLDLGDLADARRAMLWALDRATGQLIWSETLVDPLPVFAPFRLGIVSLLAVGDQLIIGTPDGRLRSLSITIRNPRWLVPAQPAPAGYAWVRPVAVSGSLFLAQRNDGIAEFRRLSDGGLRRSRNLGGAFPSGPSSVQGASATPCAPAVCAVGIDGLHLLSVENSQDRLIRIQEMRLLTAPVVDADGTAYAGATAFLRGQFLVAVSLR